MGNRLTKIYTRTGDDGTTGLADGSRVAKDSARIGAIGEVDELNCILSTVLACSIPERVSQCLVEIQHDLFNIGGELSLPKASLVTGKYVERLETWLDGFNETLPPLKEFILPGGGQAASCCHIARAVCRRVERSLYHLARTETVEKFLLVYINRLSDLLFVLCRVLARDSGAGEVYWRNPVR